MPDYNFFAAPFDLEPIRQARERIKHDEMKAVASQFTENIARTRCLVDMIRIMTHLATLYERSAMRAAFTLTGHVVLTAQEYADPVLKENLIQELIRLSDEEEQSSRTHPRAALRDEERTRNNLKMLMERYEDAVLTEGIQRVFQSMITGAWTAFEVMAGDLWETALNMHPVHLASLTSAHGDMEKVIELNYLERHGYDLSKKMGTIHRDAGRYRFQALKGNGIREAFINAFRKDGDAVKAAISNESLDALSLMRNVFVHAAGVTDDKFIKGCGSIAALAKWKSQGLQHEITLNGEDVSQLINPVVCCSMELIEAVDTWLMMHP